jgi:ATP-dependent helicase IRC3
MIQFRDYQLQAFDAVKSDIERGIKKMLIIASCGAGKTLLASNIIDNIIPLQGKQAIFLVHREELMTQTVDKFRRVHGDKLTIGVEMADYHCRGDEDFIVASVPTIGRANSERIKKFNPSRFKIVTVDETHHAVKVKASTNQNRSIILTPLRFQGQIR